MQTTRPGYEYLSAYMLGKVIQDLTVKFCDLFLKNPKFPNFPNRQIDQMVQAARSNCQNIAEGFSNPSLKGYIKLAGIAYGSNEELTKDYQDFLRQRNLETWNKNDPKVRGFREFRAVWISSTSLNTPNLPKHPVVAANMLLTLCNMEGFLLKKLVASLLEKHEKEGGFTEELYRKRTEYRKNHPQTTELPKTKPP
jgi:restriction system protein